MKYHTTKKAVMNGYSNIISVGYCDLYNLLHAYGEPEAYTSGTYGWNADVYYIGRNTVVVTGYRPFGNIKSDYDFNRAIENEVKAITDWRERAEKAPEIMERFLAHYVDC